MYVTLMNTVKYCILCIFDYNALRDQIMAVAYPEGDANQGT